MALADPIVRRLPITPTIIYLLIGVAMGPVGLGVIAIDPMKHSAWLHHAAEVGVIVSLFTVGMKLRLPIADQRLRPALFLASVSMMLTIALIAVVGVWLLRLPLGAAVLLGAVLAPTDPVLASDVQMRHPHDRDRLRLTLSAEAGLNDGTAFPFVVLGLGLLAVGDHATGWRWFFVDGVWAVAGGIGIGAALGYGLGRVVLKRTATQKKPFAFGEYLVLGIIGASYGIALQLHTYGFLSVFAAGVAMRAAELHASGNDEAADEAVSAMAAGRVPRLPAQDARAGAVYFAGALLAINEQLEHMLEVALVLIVGAVLAFVPPTAQAVWFAALLFLVIRPLAAAPVRAVARFNGIELAAIGWFGIRGIGSIYYLMFAVDGGLPAQYAEPIVALVLNVVAFSIVVHGISVTPFLQLHHRDGRKRREPAPADPPAQPDRKSRRRRAR